ncbi:MAG: apolipoprotein N-acyltransferase, partial [Pseudomonadales bacterium]|nr:apolipoprotein N-acyltransferase [Pseudomonadales bacterium]
PLICYEVAYADLARAQPADLLLTVSNDAWFGDSFGPWQHLEIARLRAAENGRPLLRATNDGISALIDHRGRLLLQSERFVAQSLHGEVVLTAGETPYHRFGDWPLLGVGLTTLAAALYRRARRRYQR